MSVIGVVAGPEQIADGTNPSRLASVDQYGNLSEVAKGLPPDATTHKILRTDAGGQIRISSTDVLVAILLELRTMNAVLTAIGNGQVTTDDPQNFRDDGDITGTLAQFS